jgi:hypothetical protein
MEINQTSAVVKGTVYPPAIFSAFDTGLGIAQTNRLV